MQKKGADSSITIKDIAAACGVSISTVSNVLNGKTNKVSKEVTNKIMSVVEETGYKPNYLAKNLRATSTKTIGVIVEDLMQFSTSPIIEGLMQQAEEMNYSVVIENMRLFGRWSDKWMHDDALFQSALKPVMNKMEALNVDGIVYIAGYEHDVRIEDRPEGIPFAMAYANTADEQIPCFKLDDESGGYISYKYLRSMGHSKIAIISGDAANPHTVNRLRGIQKALFEDGILFDPSLVVYKSWNKEGGYNGMKQLENTDITAVICMSDLIATGVYEYMYKNEMVPGREISVIGYDNHECSQLLYPTLTTISLSLEEMGNAAVSWVIDQCNAQSKNSEAKEVRISGKLVERNSVCQIGL